MPKEKPKNKEKTIKQFNRKTKFLAFEFCILFLEC